MNKADDKKWLTYWVVFSFFFVLEFFAVSWLAGCPSTGWSSACSWSGAWPPWRTTGLRSSMPGSSVPSYLKHQTKINAMVNKATAQAGDLLDKDFVTGLLLKRSNSPVTLHRQLSHRQFSWFLHFQYYLTLFISEILTYFFILPTSNFNHLLQGQFVQYRAKRFL